MEVEWADDERAQTKQSATSKHEVLAASTRDVTRTLQPSLSVGRADDPLEREADRIAEQVVRRLASGSGPTDESTSRVTRSAANAAGGSPQSALPTVSRIARSIHRRPDATTSSASSIGAEGGTEGGQRSTARVARSAANAAGAGTQSVLPNVSRIARSIHRRPDADTSSASSIGAEGGTVDSQIERRIGRVRSGGAPLDAGVRRSMEDAFGADFGDVRVHRGPEPTALNEAIGARAFTIGSDIFFGATTPDPTTSPGQHLLAHELTHTIQQRGASSVSRTIRRAVVAEPTVDASATDVGESSDDPVPSPAGETEGETVMEGSIAEVGLPVEQIVSTGPPPGMVADATDPGPARRLGPSGAAIAATDQRARPSTTTYKVRVSDVSDRSTISQQATVPVDGMTDAVSAKVAASPKLTAGANVNPFGALNSRYTTSKVKWKAKKKADSSTINLGFTLNLASQWGTTNGGRTDVASASSAAITADNYKTAVSDLTPGLQGGSWVAPRTQFWSQKICERHEKYHYKDVSKWFKKTGKKLVMDDLNTKSVAVATTDDQTAVNTKVSQLVQTSIATITNAHIVYMNGTGLSYYNYPSEVLAFGDGKKPYMALAKGVQKRGVALEKKRDKAAKKSAG